MAGVPPNSSLLQKCPDWEETTISYENFVLRRGTIQPPTFQLSVATEKGSFRLIPEGLIPNLLHLPSAPHSPSHTHYLSHLHTHSLSHTQPNGHRCLGHRQVLWAPGCALGTVSPQQGCQTVSHEHSLRERTRKDLLPPRGVHSPKPLTLVGGLVHHQADHPQAKSYCPLLQSQTKAGPGANPPG